MASHVFGPSTTQVDPDSPDRGSRQTTNWHHTAQDPGPLHWFPHRLTDSAAPPELRDVSQGTIRPTVGISPNVIAPSRAVDVDVPIERPSLPHFVASDTRQFSLIVAADKRVASSPLSRGVDSDTHSKRLYAAAHAPLAPPTSPIADLLCHERDILSSSSDSDYPPVSQRENRYRC